MAMRVFLLDADTLIRADSTYYPIRRFPVFWGWLRHNGAAGLVKVPLEQYEEVVAGKGELVAWLEEKETREALLLPEDADPDLVAKVTIEGYAPDLDDAEQEKVGRDPFLIAYAYSDPENRIVVSFETSAPSRQRGNRKIPDVCNDLGVECGTLFDVIEVLDFTTDWKPD